MPKYGHDDPFYKKCQAIRIHLLPASSVAGVVPLCSMRNSP